MEIKGLEKFNPTVAELTAMVEKTKGIKATDLKNKNQLVIVRSNRIVLKNARIKIAKIGKDLREEALSFQKQVISKEKELIAIIEPEEERLASIEDEAKELAIKEERLKILPERKERLLSITGKAGTSEEIDELILSMDDVEFESHYNICVADHNEKIRLETEEKQRIESERIRIEQDEKEAKIAKEREAIDIEKKKLEDEKNRIKHEEEIKAAAEKAREEEKARQEKLAKEEKERIAEEAKLEEKRIKLEKERIALEKKQEMEKLEKQKRYIIFLKSIGYTEATKKDFKTEETETSYVLYKKVGEFKK